MRKPSTKDIAEYFRLALEAGLCREDEIESWADRMIIETAPPIPAWLLNLSSESETSKNKLLEAVPGEANCITAWSLLFSQLGIANRIMRLSHDQVVSLLFRWALEGGIPEPFYKTAYNLRCQLDGVKDGWGSEKQFLKSYEDFFIPFRAFESLLPQSTVRALP